LSYAGLRLAIFCTVWSKHSTSMCETKYYRLYSCINRKIYDKILLKLGGNLSPGHKIKNFFSRQNTQFPLKQGLGISNATGWRCLHGTFCIH